MPHKCTKCNETYPDASPVLLSGCTRCGARFFFYIREEALQNKPLEVQETLFDLAKIGSEKLEKEIREMTGLLNKPETPVILNIESIKRIAPGKYEIDIENLLSKKRVLVYALDEGKYIIDLDSHLKTNKKEIEKKIRDPKLFMQKKEELWKKPYAEEKKEVNPEIENSIDNKFPENQETLDKFKEEEKTEIKKEEDL